MFSLNHYVECEAERLVAEAIANHATELVFDCLRLEILPASLSQLPQLKKLSLKGCRQLTDIGHIAALTELETLELADCESLSDLQPIGALKKLRRLNVSGCDQLVDLTLIAQCSGLQQLDLSRCWRIRDLTPLSQLSCLQQLDLSKCRQVSDLTPLAQISALQQLKLSECLQVSDLTPLIQLFDLEQLDLSWCQQVSDLTPLVQLIHLQQLDLSDGWQASDLMPLTQLSGLQQLDLGGCQQVTDLEPLAQLIKLQQLDLSGCDQATDFTPLTQLNELQQLDLSWCQQISDLALLAQLPSLQQLDLNGCRQLTNLEPLAQLISLQQLGLNECLLISDMTPLAQLSSLQQLDLSECLLISDLTSLAQLSSLQQLDLSECLLISDLTPLAQLSSLRKLDLSNCWQISDLTSLAQLSALQQLNLGWCQQVGDLTPLAQLSGLQQLDLSMCEQVSDLTPLAQIPGLQQLDLGRCKQVSDLTPLAQLSALQQLDLRHSGVSPDSQATLRSFPKLQSLACSFPFSCLPATSLIHQLPYLQELQADTLHDAPQELAYVGGRDAYSGAACLDRILAWQKDILASGEASNREVKIFVLGNGRVGKTQICRQLQGLPFDDGVASTHGIHLGRFPLLCDENGDTTLFGNLWDFGGQDVYLGTHSLFLDERAVYVIVWTPEHENTKAFEENSVPMQNRPLVYWLEYVRSLAGAEAPVIVVQSQCDRVSDEQEAPMPGQHGFARLQRTACSAKQRDGMERFVPALKAAARMLQERYGAVRLPQSWVSIADQLRAQRDAGHKTLSWPGYVALCQAAHSQAIPEVSIDYLHRAGQVFWRAGLFDQQVVLDQAWALSGIYAVLDRAHTLPIIRSRDGEFTQELLSALVWGEYSAQEQSLFLSMMQQCGVCFAISKGVYIAPGLLPGYAAASAKVAQIWQERAAEARAYLEYAFLHEGVLRAALCAIGQQAGRLAAYWDAGVAYYDDAAKGPVRIAVESHTPDAGCAKGRIVVEAGGSGAAKVVAHLIKSIQQIRIGQAPTLHWDIGQTQQVTGHEASHARSKPEQQAFAEIQPRAIPSVYVSYAWGGESDATVEALQQALKPWVNVLRDIDVMLTGDSIRQFEEEIGRGFCVIVVLSGKYTQSVDCMRELGLMWQYSQCKPEQFAQRVIPVVLEDAGIEDVEDRLACVEYWQAKLTRLENSARRIGPMYGGKSTPQRLQDINTFTMHLADALDTFADRVMPRPPALSAAQFAPVVELVKKRCGL
ncbi:leucine-rich repeat domain-containing protein [Aquaspirillum sp. LM1]|uniref:leucine-rich repeat domain-containing protein n=1 Tax=Aquaspirillum sp. LM1 TaxID=1938604 RepID=UPI0015C52963|nr:leucine-rich repeat domain-containing protein [Aquaspirillum sp. LM1]